MAHEKPGTITAVIADTHIGGQTALSLPQWTLLGKPGEEIPYQANFAQVWIYEKWVEYWRYVCHLAGVVGKTRKHRIVTLHLGDIVDGVHHGSIQSLQNPDDQVEMAAEILTRVANLSDGGVYIADGTEAHAGPAHSHEYIIAKRIGAHIDQSHLLDIDGIKILAYHHGRAGRRPWSSSAASIVAEARLSAQDNGEPIPRYVFTAHNHIIDDSGEKDPHTRAVSLPTWQLRTAFSWKVAAGQSRSDIGGLIIHPNGTLDFSQARYRGAPGQRGLTKV